MKRDFNPEMIKGTDDITAKRIEEDFEPDWEMDTLFEKSYEKYEDMKKSADMAPDSNEETVKADIIAAGTERKNIFLRITACAAAAALVICGIKLLGSGGETVPADNHMFVTDDTVHPDIISDAGKFVMTDEQYADREYSKEIYSTGNFKSISDIAEFSDGTYIYGTLNDSGSAVNLYGSPDSNLISVPVDERFGYPLSVCASDDIMYIYTQDGIFGLDRANGEEVCRFTGPEEGDEITLPYSSYAGKRRYASFTENICFDGEDIALEISGMPYITFIDSELKKIRSILNLSDLTGDSEAEAYYFKLVTGDKIYFITQNYPEDENENDTGTAALYCCDRAKESAELLAEISDMEGTGNSLLDYGDSLIYVTADIPSAGNDNSVPVSHVYIIGKSDGEIIRKYDFEDVAYVRFDNNNEQFIAASSAGWCIINPETGEKSEIPLSGARWPGIIYQSGSDLFTVSMEQLPDFQQAVFRDTDGNAAEITSGDAVKKMSVSADGEICSEMYTDSGEWTLCILNRDGTEKDSMSFKEPGRSSLRYCVASDRIYFLTYDNNLKNEIMLVYDRNGTKINEYEVETTYTIEKFVYGKSGVYAVVYSNGKVYVYSVSDSGIKKVAEFDNSADSSSVIIENGNQSYDFCCGMNLNGDEGSGAVYGYSVSEKESTEILKLSDYGIGKCTSMWVSYDDDAFFFYNEMRTDAQCDDTALYNSGSTEYEPYYYRLVRNKD